MEQDAEKSDRLSAPYLSIDGSLIRGVRESKKLTQLYVASVVGVTTDTISRWENNRYPSIKRENAEKLATALDVDLAEILRREESGGAAEAEVPPAPVRSAKILLFSGFLGLALLFFAIYFSTREPAAAPSAVRWVPRFAAPGEVIPVQVKVFRKQGEEFGFILKEKIPDSFRLVSALPPVSGGGPTASVLKWLIPAGKTSLTVSYTVQLPAAPPLRQEEKIRGEIVVPGGTSNRTEPVGGGSSILVGGYHWADANGDGRIDDDEIMPAYYVCEAMKGLGLDWKVIEDIWSGKGYRWDARQGFTVIR